MPALLPKLFLLVALLLTFLTSYQARLQTSLNPGLSSQNRTELKNLVSPKGVDSKTPVRQNTRLVQVLILYDLASGSLVFISEDPLQDGNNWHAYAYGSPLMFVDPLGYEGFSTGAKRFGGDIQDMGTALASYDTWANLGSQLADNPAGTVVNIGVAIIDDILTNGSRVARGLAYIHTDSGQAELTHGASHLAVYASPLVFARLAKTGMGAKVATSLKGVSQTAKVKVAEVIAKRLGNKGESCKVVDDVANVSDTVISSTDKVGDFSVSGYKQLVGSTFNRTIDFLSSNRRQNLRQLLKDLSEEARQMGATRLQIDVINARNPKLRRVLENQQTSKKFNLSIEKTGEASFKVIKEL